MYLKVNCIKVKTELSRKEFFFWSLGVKTVFGVFNINDVSLSIYKRASLGLIQYNSESFSKWFLN